jgi:hypothetical protein
VKLIGDAKLVKGKTGGPETPIAPLCICPLVGVPTVWVTVIVNIFVVVLKTSVPVPVDVEVFGVDSAAPVRVAVKVTFGLGIIGSSFPQEATTVITNKTAKNLLASFIIE